LRERKGEERASERLRLEDDGRGMEVDLVSTNGPCVGLFCIFTRNERRDGPLRQWIRRVFPSLSLCLCFPGVY
jgi:hypothetical protein